LIFATTALVFTALVVFQFYLAGLGLFGSSPDFSSHRTLGTSWLPVSALLIFLGAVIGGRSRLDVTAALGAFVLVLFTSALPSRAESDPSLAALHPVSALATFLVGSVLAYRSFLAVRAAR
jgi:hypothetical protein